MEQEKKIYDFTTALVEVEFDKYEKVNISKMLANTIHQGTADIGVDDVAREIYHNGKVEITDDSIRKQIIVIVLNSLLIAPVKQAVRKMLEG